MGPGFGTAELREGPTHPLVSPPGWPFCPLAFRDSPGWSRYQSPHDASAERASPWAEHPAGSRHLTPVEPERVGVAVGKDWGSR